MMYPNVPDTHCAVAALIQINDSVRKMNPGVDLAPFLNAKVTREELAKKPEGLALCGGLRYWQCDSDNNFVEPTEDDVPSPSDFEDQVFGYTGDSYRLFGKSDLTAVEFLVVSFPLLKILTMTYGDFEKIAALARKERSKYLDPQKWDDRYFTSQRISELTYPIEEMGGRLDYGMVAIHEVDIKAA